MFSKLFNKYKAKPFVRERHRHTHRVRQTRAQQLDRQASSRQTGNHEIPTYRWKAQEEKPRIQTWVPTL